MSTKGDLGLQALLKTTVARAEELPIDLLKKVYEIQKIHQFDRDRDVSLQEMQRLVEASIGADRNSKKDEK